MRAEAHLAESAAAKDGARSNIAELDRAVAHARAVDRREDGFLCKRRLKIFGVEVATTELLDAVIQNVHRLVVHAFVDECTDASW